MGKIQVVRSALVPPYTIHHHQYLCKIYRRTCFGGRSVVQSIGETRFWNSLAVQDKTKG